MERNTHAFAWIANQIENHPEQYDQGVWANANGCGTAYCIAGWEAVRHGWEAIITSCPCDEDECDDEDVFLRHRETGEIKGNSYASDLASNTLGLSVDEQNTLFHHRWRPPSGITVPNALRAIGRGAPTDRDHPAWNDIINA